jgi:hypothetical protein
MSAPLRVYHIGNSVTDTLRYDSFRDASSAGGQSYAYGRHMIPGTPLDWIFDHPDSGFKVDEFGHYPQALTQHTWDVLTLQPFDRQLESDRTVAQRLIKMALPKSPNLRVVVYSRWPRKNDAGQLDYLARWNRPYTNQWDDTNESKDYFETLTKAIRKDFPNLRIDLAPVGDTMAAMERQRPGSAVELYEDGIHLGPRGSFLVGAVFFATLFRQAPARFSPEPYKVADETYVNQARKLAWETVRAHPLSGVAR